MPLKQKKIHGTYVKCVLNEKINSQGTDLKQTPIIRLSLCQPYFQNDKDSFRILCTLKVCSNAKSSFYKHSVLTILISIHWMISLFCIGHEILLKF